MLKHRVIPCLLLKNNSLVKTIKFDNAKYVGDPINAIKIFNDKEVDELIVLDVMASKECQEPNFDLIEQFASECFMPLCYGGGIKNLEQAHRLFDIGIEKISIQTSAIENLSFITRLANRFGSQSIVVSIDVKKNWRGVGRLYASAYGRNAHIEWPTFAKNAVDSGAGELLINSVDCDGMMKGMDLKIIKEIVSIVDVPVVAVGGVGDLNDIKQAIEVGASAVAAGSFFVFHGPHNAVLITYPEYQKLETLLG
ncbi:MAG: imidazole glycerol phosphate synthase subunit HisF [Cellvibrionales bacterium]|jgi:imidazole glycerol-phosphate synthase subunit HisF|nr:imidazole glycerol phosphate synthase subunit HisF [Cellvibrionales bacterium]